MTRALSAFAAPARFLNRIASPASSEPLLGSSVSQLSVSRPTLAPLGMASTLTPEVLVGDASEDAHAAAEAAAKAAKAAKQKAAGTTLDVHVIGLSIHHAAVDVREKLAIAQADWVQAAADLVAYSGGVIEEAAVLSTCNRFELYLSSRDQRAANRAAAAWLAERSGLTQGVLRRNLFLLSGEDASWHLLRVSAGLDSLIVGEGQILAQVNACHQAAISTGAVDEATGEAAGPAGSGGKVLSRLLNQAVGAGKRVRSETSISKGAVSISSAAVEFSQARLPKDLDMPLSEARVVIAGAGTMTRLLVTHLKSHGVSKIVLINRSVGPGSSAQVLADEHEDVEWDIRTPDQLYPAIADADVVYMSTSAVEPIVTADGLAADVIGGEGKRDVGASPLSIVDISVPRNVETAVDDLEGVFSYNVDDLKAVVARNTASRTREIIEAELLLKEELGDFLGWHQSLGAVPTIAKLQERAESMRAEEFSKNEKKLKNLSDKELEAVERLSRGIVNKLLHGPMAHLRSPEGVDDKRRTLNTLSALFKLDDSGQQKKGGKKGGKKN
jgi:glutamyl-tRNA reductase